MSENKTQPTKASVEAFVEAVDGDDRRRDCRALVDLMREVTGEEPRMWGESMVGFGQYHYKYASGREGDWFVTGFSPRKRDLTLYLMAGFDGREDLLARLGKHKTGKACLYIKRLADVDEGVLRELVEDSFRRMQSDDS